MKKNVFLKIIIICCVGCATIACLMGCTEDIDKSNLYTFTGETATDYIKNNSERFGSFLKLISRVKSSDKKANASTMAALLSARGNYTCFVPNDEAIAEYLDTLYCRGEINDTTIEHLSDSLARDIVFNTIIDHGNNTAFPSTTYPEGALSVTNLNDKYIDISFGNDPDGRAIIIVNADTKIIKQDVQVTNGYVQEIDHVLSSASSSIADLIMDTKNLSLFGKLIKLTGFDEKTTAYEDVEYADGDYAGIAGPMSNNGLETFKGIYPEHRYFGYTAFVETDSVMKRCLRLDGNPSESDFIEALKYYLKENAAYDGGTSWGSDYENDNNWLNQFVGYHFLPERIIWDRLVIFANESGFTTGSPNNGKKFSVNVWDYYETMAKGRRLLKVTGTRNGKFLNRISVYDEKYKEIADVVNDKNNFSSLNIELRSDNGKNKNQALNGYYYPIEDILLWTEKVPNQVLNERMRYDICSLLPELMTNNHRRIGDSEHRAWYYSSDYFESKNGGSGTMLNVSKETHLCYLTNTMNTGSWINYQSDEFNIQGQYDFVLKLPPVPYSGTYEIRYGITANSNRGMGQVYIGTNPDNLHAIGIPIDLRLGGESSALGWVADKSLNEDEIEEMDKQLRNKDYMKGPKYFVRDGPETGREYSNTLRKIIYRGDLEEGMTYYLRFKSVLESTNTEFYFDYLEFVPKTIYNSDEKEDKW